MVWEFTVDFIQSDPPFIELMSDSPNCSAFLFERHGRNCSDLTPFQLERFGHFLHYSDKSFKRV